MAQFKTLKVTPQEEEFNNFGQISHQTKPCMCSSTLLECSEKEWDKVLSENLQTRIHIGENVFFEAWDQVSSTACYVMSLRTTKPPADGTARDSDLSKDPDQFLSLLNIAQKTDRRYEDLLISFVKTPVWKAVVNPVSLLYVPRNGRYRAWKLMDKLYSNSRGFKKCYSPNNELIDCVQLEEQIKKQLHNEFFMFVAMEKEQCNTNGSPSHEDNDRYSRCSAVSSSTTAEKQTIERRPSLGISRQTSSGELEAKVMQPDRLSGLRSICSGRSGHFTAVLNQLTSVQNPVQVTVNELVSPKAGSDVIHDMYGSKRRIFVDTTAIEDNSGILLGQKVTQMPISNETRVPSKPSALRDKHVKAQAIEWDKRPYWENPHSSLKHNTPRKSNNIKLQHKSEPGRRKLGKLEPLPLNDTILITTERPVEFQVLPGVSGQKAKIDIAGSRRAAKGFIHPSICIYKHITKTRLYK